MACNEQTLPVQGTWLEDRETRQSVPSMRGGDEEGLHDMRASTMEDSPEGRTGDPLPGLRT